MGAYKHFDELTLDIFRLRKTYKSSITVHFNQFYSQILLRAQANMKVFNKLNLDKSIRSKCGGVQISISLTRS